MEGSSHIIGAGIRQAVTLLTVLCLSTAAAGQDLTSSQIIPDWRKKRFDTQDGLPHNTVTAVGEDFLGYLWIGTVDGLARFDGSSIRPARVDSAWGSRFIKAVLGDGHGRLWIGTEAGLHLVDARRLQEMPLQMEPAWGSGIQSLFATDAGDVLASCGAGVYRCRDDGRCLLETVTEHGRPLEDDYVFEFSEDADGVGIGLTAGGRILVKDPERTEWSVRLGKGSDYGGAFLLGKGGLVMLLRSDSVSAHAYPTRSTELEPPTSSLMETPLFAHVGNLVSLQPNDKLARHFLDEDTTSSLRNHIRSQYCRDNLCWFGTLNGLYRVTMEHSPFRVAENQPSALFGASRSPAVAAIKEQDGAIYIGTLGSGLWKIRENAVEQVRPSGGRAATVIWTLAGDRDGNLWIGADNGLFLLEKGGSAYRELPNPMPSPLIVNSLAMVGDSTLVVGGFERLFIWDLPRREWIHFTDSSERRISVQSMLRTRDGHWLFGTFDAKILSWTGGKSDLANVFELPPSTARSSEGFWDLLEDRFGTIWAASDVGLTGFLANGETAHFRNVQGLPGNIAYALEEDSRGRIWVSTDRGLCVFEPDSAYPEPPVFRRFDLQDGLPMLEFNRRASARIGETLWFGGIDGWVSFEPDELGEDKAFPPVYVQHAEIRGVNGTSFVEAGTIGTLQLPSQTRALALGYGSVDLTDAATIRYKYRLLGADYDTLNAGFTRQANYANLRPGNYLFQVWSSDKNGVWNPEPASVRVEVLAAFWETTLFRVVAIGSLLLFFWLVYRIRVRRLLAMERMRLRIAADLHDQVGSGLSSLAMMSEIAGKSPETTADIWPRLADSARSMAQDLREIVWYTNPKFDRLDHLVERMKDLTYQIVPEITIEMEFPSNVPATPVPPDFRRDWMLSYRELLHNVAKHAKAGSITVRVEMNQKLMKLTVVDDGVGFDITHQGRGMGLQNIRDRIARLKGSAKWTSSPEMGTMVEIKVPLP